MELAFESTLWRWEGEGAWYFVSLPPEQADELEDRHGPRAGFGSIPVEVTIGATTWRTSLFPSSRDQTFLLPVKKAVRQRERLDEGDTVHVVLDVGEGGS